MSTTTENYGLKKPEQEDFYNIDDFNENADIIDTQLKTLSDEVKKAAQNDEVTQVNQKVGSTADSGGSSTAGSVFAKLNKVISDITTHMGRWTSTRAGYIDTINTNSTNAKNYTVTNNNANKTGVLSQKLSYLINLLENGTYGLSALKSNGMRAVKSVQKGTLQLSGSPEIITTYESGDGYSDMKYFYKDITISPVDVTKSVVFFNSPSNARESYTCRLVNSTTLRIYLESENSNSVTSKTVYYYYRTTWQVVEFY